MTLYAKRSANWNRFLAEVRFHRRLHRSTPNELRQPVYSLKVVDWRSLEEQAHSPTKRHGVCGFFHYVAALLLRTVSPLRGWLDNNNRRVSCTPHFPRMNSSSPWWKTLLTGRLRIILDRTRVGVRAQEALWSHRATPVGQRIRSVLHNTHPSTRL